jgi:formiminotetrahydrofolate cyclodeaminase
MLKEQTLEQFAAAVSSGSPTPGGGSVAALAGALGASLLAMYCFLSAGLEKYGAAALLLEQAGLEARALAASLLLSVDRDAGAFDRVMEAYRLPKEAQAEKERRRQAIQAALVEAARVPLHTARECLRVLELAGAVAGRGNPSAVTDLGVSILQGWCGLQGACYNVLINLASIADEKIRAELSREAAELTGRGERVFAENRQKLEQEIKK